MTVRKRKKKNILRGHRTHGHGDTKNGRGAGSRGGVGRAGSHKHKFTKYAGEFGIEKKQVIGKPIGPSMNLDQIEQMLPKWLASEKVVKEGNSIVVDGKKVKLAKIVGRGKLVSKIIFENLNASKKAVEKIKENGSEIKGLKVEQEEKKEGAEVEEEESK